MQQVWLPSGNQSAEWSKVKWGCALQGTVGAGLPVISTLKDLLETGDELQTVEGILSGTLSFIFNSFGAGKTFSQVVADAKARGFTEPDPREDLAGATHCDKAVIRLDVAQRKSCVAFECDSM